MKPGVEALPAPVVEPVIEPKKLGFVRRILGFWLDSSQTAEEVRNASVLVRAIRIIPFALIHVACFAVIWVGWSWPAVIVAAALYSIRMFAITGFYHRYFSHRTFRTSRFMQFMFGVLGCSAVQRGPLWWAAHHREHHRHSDQEGDLHSPRLHGFWWAHLFWFLQPENAATNTKAIPDLYKFPELRWIDRYDSVVPLLLGVSMFLLGWGIEAIWPSSGTTAWQMVVWGFFISTVLCYHATYTINSLCHVWGGRRFNTTDDSRNNFWLALITFGEGWHNNHHHFPGSARQGFFWYELDFTYYTLWVMSKLGIVWDLNPVPARVYAQIPPKA
jgi:stearoyl-CoA desaturase (delta-9 desaturase)